MYPLYQQLSKNLNSYQLTVSAEKLHLKQSLLKSVIHLFQHSF